VIKILKSGAQTSIQDGGRPGIRHLGIPVSGAADRLSYALVNASVGNPWHAAALECTLGGLELEFTLPGQIALGGADMSATLNSVAVTPYSPLSVSKGDILTLAYARQGARAYIAVAGGIKGTDFMGSLSTYAAAKLGGLLTPESKGRALQDGDRLTVNSTPPMMAARILPREYAPHIGSHIILRVLAGPEYERLTPQSQREIFTTTFQASPASDRMGSRLDGSTLSLRQPLSMTSGPLLAGTVQVPPNGQAILTLSDGHCTGGYARALQVITADLWQTGQIGPGMKVSFRRAQDTEAHDILKRRTAFYSGLIEGFAF